MPEMREAAVNDLEPAQAAELALLVELEARWENLRMSLPGARESAAATQNLLVIQKAYDAFRSQLVAYNKRFRPAHVPELLLNTPPRLSAWCQSMHALCLRVEHAPRAQAPVQLLEKAYRLAVRVGARLDRDHLPRPTPPATVRAAAEALEALRCWCESLETNAALPPPQPATAPESAHAHRE